MANPSSCVKTAFLQSGELGRNVYLNPPLEAHVMKGYIWKLLKPVYGLNDASKLWYLRVKHVLERLGYSMCMSENALFIKRENMCVTCVIIVHVDDFLLSGSIEETESVISALKETFIIGKQVKLPLKFTGMQISIPKSGFLNISQFDFIRNLRMIKTTSEKRPLFDNEVSTLRGIDGKLQWCSGQTRPDICFDVNLLVCDLKNAETDRLKTANKILKRIQYDNNYSICYRDFEREMNKDSCVLLVFQMLLFKTCRMGDQREATSYIFMNYPVGSAMYCAGPLEKSDV